MTNHNPSECVLITGGAGFIGTALANQLVAGGYQVVVVDNMLAEVHGPTGPPRRLASDVRFLHGDVVFTPAWEAVFEELRPMTVVHLAAETSTGRSFANAPAHAATNVVGTTCLFDAMRRFDHFPRHLVLASSRAVYGEGPWEGADGICYPAPRCDSDLREARWDPVDGTGGVLVPVPTRADWTAPSPSSIYGATKLAQEHLCTAWAAAAGTALSIVRLQNVYGPGQSLINPYTGIVSLFAQLALARQRIELYEDGQVVRDFVFIDDVVSALTAVIADPPTTRRLIDVGSGEPTTLEHVARFLAEQHCAPDPFVSGRFRVGDVRAASCDLTETRRHLDWEPKWCLTDGLRALLSWITEHKPDFSDLDALASEAAVDARSPALSLSR